MSVDISKVNETVLRQHAAGLLGLFAEAQKVPIPDLVVRMEQHFKQVPPSDVSECSNCGGDSSVVECTVCPFCGSADEEEGEGTSQAPTTSVQEETIGAPAPEKKETPMTAQTTNGMTKTSSGALKKKKPKANEKPAEIVESPSTGLALAGAKPLSTNKVSDLDAAVKRIDELRGNAGVNFYNIGLEVRKIYEGDLWRLRTTESGKPIYKSFEQFCAEEVQLNKALVYRFMEISKQFNEAEVRRYGSTNLRSILAAPKEDRDRILNKLNAGELSTTREVEAEVQKARKTKGVTRVERAGKSKRTAAASASASTKAASKAKVTTIAVPEGKNTVKLFCRDTAEKRAKRLGDKPVGELECENGVKLKFAVRESTSGELILIFESKR